MRLRRWLSRPAVTLVLLGLLLAAPLTAGDKGLWLTLHGASDALFQTTFGSVAPEHSTLLPDRPARVVTAARISRADVADTLLTATSGNRALAGAQWASTAPESVAARPHLGADRPDPRAPRLESVERWPFPVPDALCAGT